MWVVSERVAGATENKFVCQRREDALRYVEMERAVWPLAEYEIEYVDENGDIDIGYQVDN